MIKKTLINNDFKLLLKSAEYKTIITFDIHSGYFEKKESIVKEKSSGYTYQ